MRHILPICMIGGGAGIAWGALGNSLDMSLSGIASGTIGTILVIFGIGMINEAMVKDYTTRQRDT